MSVRRRITRLSCLFGAGAAACAVAATSASAAGGTQLTLSQLPALLAADSANGVIALALPAHPDTTSLQAGAAATSAFSGLTGKGITVVTYRDPTPAQIASATEPVVQIIERPGAASVSARRLNSGSVAVTVSGEGRSLVDAAKLLSTSWLAGVNRASTTVPASLTAAVANLKPAGGSERLGPVTASANGVVRLTEHLTVPVQKQIAKGRALLSLAVEYNAPGGGRLTFRLNGHVLGAGQSRGAGNTFVYRFKVASDWTDGPNLAPGYYLNAGDNTLTITARPVRRQLVSQVGAQLALTSASQVQMALSQRTPGEQLDLWPFPLFTGSWAHSTVVTAPADQLSQRALSTLITALANTERVTGVPATPQVTYAKPTAAQRRGNLLVYGDPLALAGIASSTPVVSGLLAEQKLTAGGVAVIATDAQALAAFDAGYYPGRVNGAAAIVNAAGVAHTIVSAPAASAFTSPRFPWLKPAAGLAALVLLWIAARVFLAYRRLRARPPLPPGVIS